MSGPSISLDASRSNHIIGIDFGMQNTQQPLRPRITEFALTCDGGTTCSSIGYVHMSEVSWLSLVTETGKILTTYKPEGSKTVKSWPDSGQTTEWVPT